MNNYLNSGDTVNAIAPNGGVVSSMPVLIGLLFGIPVTTAVAGATFALRRKGVFHDVTKDVADAWTAGDVIYWDDVAKAFTKTAATNRRVAIALDDATQAATTGKVVLVPSLGITIADLGVTVVADNTKPSIDTALAVIVAKINAVLDGLR